MHVEETGYDSFKMAMTAYSEIHDDFTFWNCYYSTLQKSPVQDQP